MHIRYNHRLEYRKKKQFVSRSNSFVTHQPSCDFRLDAPGSDNESQANEKERKKEKIVYLHSAFVCKVVDFVTETL